MHKVEPYVVVTFGTTTAAFAMQEAGRASGLQGRLAPVPRQLSAGCGLAWREPAANEGALRGVIADAGVEAQSVTLLDL